MPVINNENFDGIMVKLASADEIKEWSK